MTFTDVHCAHSIPPLLGNAPQAIPGGSPYPLHSSCITISRSRGYPRWYPNPSIHSWLLDSCLWRQSYLPISHILQAALLPSCQSINSSRVTRSCISWWCPCHAGRSSWLSLCCEHEGAQHHPLWLCHHQVSINNWVSLPQNWHLIYRFTRIASCKKRGSLPRFLIFRKSIRLASKGRERGVWLGSLRIWRRSSENYAYLWFLLLPQYIRWFEYLVRVRRELHVLMISCVTSVYSLVRIIMHGFKH